MTQYFTTDVTDIDELELAVESLTFVYENTEAVWQNRTSILAGVRLEPVLAAETGVLPMVQLTHEHPDQTEGEDAAHRKDKMHPTPHATQLDRTSSAPKILIVEDTMELVEIIQATLERVNMVTYHEMHADRVMALIDDQHPDLVLLDLGLPNTSGWKILDAMKEYYTQAQKEMPVVIIITAYGDPANRLVGKLQNIHSYLLKPFTSDEIERVVVNALNGAE
jgi:CheY-like chemotaxis protein